jgi:hypothetical protein
LKFDTGMTEPAPHELLDQPERSYSSLSSPLEDVVTYHPTMVDLPGLNSESDAPAPTHVAPVYVIPPGPVQYSRSTKTAEQLRQTIMAVSAVTLCGAITYMAYALYLCIVLSYTRPAFSNYDFPNSIASVVVGLVICGSTITGIASSAQGRARESVYRLLFYFIGANVFALTPLIIMIIYGGFCLYWESFILSIVGLGTGSILLSILIVCGVWRLRAMEREDLELEKTADQSPQQQPQMVVYAPEVLMSVRSATEEV